MIVDDAGTGFSCDRCHEFLLVDGAQRGAADRGIVERRIQLIEAQHADQTGGFHDLDA